MQLTFSFLTPPRRREVEVWQHLTDEQRQAVIDQLAHLVAKAAVARVRQEQEDD